MKTNTKTLTYCFGVVGAVTASLFLWSHFHPQYPPFTPASDFAANHEKIDKACDWNGFPRSCTAHVHIDKEVAPHDTHYAYNGVVMNTVLVEHAPQCAIVSEDYYEPGNEKKLEPGMEVVSDGAPAILGPENTVARVFWCEQYPLKSSR